MKDLLRNYRIRDHQSEAYYQQQNFAERYIQELKKLANRVRNKSGCPPEMIMHVLEYVVFIWNRTARRILRWRTPIEALTGQTPDISVLLHFRFWQRVYISNYQQRDGTGFPSESNEIEVRFIGFAETTGHSMTFKVFNPATGAVLYRSRLRAADEDDVVHPGNDPNDDDRDGNPTGIDADAGATGEENGEQPDDDGWHDELNEQPTNNGSSDGNTHGASDQATAGNAGDSIESGVNQTRAESRGASGVSNRNQAQPRGATGTSNAAGDGIASRPGQDQDQGRTVRTTLEMLVYALRLLPRFVRFILQVRLLLQLGPFLQMRIHVSIAQQVGIPVNRNHILSPR